MSPELEALIERARHHVMSSEEVFEQRVSFVWGQLMDSHPEATKEEVRAAILAFDGK